MDELATRPDQAQIHPLTLRFCDRDLEAGFRAARAGANLRQLRVSLLIAATLNVGFAPLDYLVLTQNVFTALIIRVLEPQGQIEIKGKGGMTTWHLIDRLRVPNPTSV